GPDRLPHRIRRGYLTASGVFVALERFAVTALPGLAEALQAPPVGRPDAIAAYLHAIGASPSDPSDHVFDALAGAVRGARPFTPAWTWPWRRSRGSPTSAPACTARPASRS